MTTEAPEKPVSDVELPETEEKLEHVSAPLSAWQERAKSWGYTDDQTAAAGVVQGEEYAPHKSYDPESTCEGTFRVQDKSETVWVVQCDRCRCEVGVNMRTCDPERLLAERLGEAGIPEMFAGKEFDKDEQAQQEAARTCRDWIKRFRREPLPAVALFGRSGRGKSHLLSLMVETLIRVHGTEAIYRSAIGLLDELAQGFDAGTYEKRWARLLEVPVLALDDLGAERMTEWRQERLAELVDARYRSERPLLVATNIPPQRWEQAFGQRAASRLRGMTVALFLDGPDRRVTAQQNLDI